ncbi:hypothetical protein D3C76_1626160 [compost metagenome]
MLVDIRINVIGHITVFTISGQNGFFVPGIDFVVVIRPGRSTPSQDAHFKIRVHCLGICGKLEAGMPGNICLFIGRTHSRRVRSGGVIAVVAHLDFHMRHERMFSTK